MVIATLPTTESGAVEQAMTETRHYRHFYWEWQRELDSGDSDLHFCVHWLHQRWLTRKSWYDSQHFFTQERNIFHSKCLLPLSTLPTLCSCSSYRQRRLCNFLAPSGTTCLLTPLQCTHTSEQQLH